MRVQRGGNRKNFQINNKIIDLYISQTLEIKVTEASTVHCTQGCSVNQKVLRAQHMLPLPIKSAKTNQNKFLFLNISKKLLAFIKLKFLK